MCHIQNNTKYTSSQSNKYDISDKWPISLNQSETNYTGIEYQVHFKHISFITLFLNNIFASTNMDVFRRQR